MISRKIYRSPQYWGKEGSKNLILKYYSSEKESEIEFAFTVESAKKVDDNSLELVLNTSSSQKNFNASHINYKKSLNILALSHNYT